MKHAGPQALDRLEPLLGKLRRLAGLQEKSRGVFYRGSKAFLHFHEHGEGELHADVRLEGTQFDRFAVTTAAERKALLARIAATLRDGKAPRLR